MIRRSIITCLCSSALTDIRRIEEAEEIGPIIARNYAT